VAERVGFEPTRLSPNGFQDRRLQPLGHLSAVEDSSGPAPDGSGDPGYPRARRPSAASEDALTAPLPGPTRALVAAVLAVLVAVAPGLGSRPAAAVPPPATAWGGTSAGIAALAASSGEVDPKLARRLQNRLDRWRERRGAPGVAAAVRLPDGGLWVGVSGLAEVSPIARPVRASTPFVIGSVTKTFVAALVLKLQEDGVLSIDDPVSRWLPKYPDGDRITVRMLLNHRSGIFNYFEHRLYPTRVFGRPGHHWKVGQILTLKGPTYFAPGKGFRYSNTNYILLGRIVRKATGRAPARLIRERFLEPLGMRDTFFQGDEPIGKRPAQGYWKRQGGGFTGFSDGTWLRPHTSAATVAWTAGAMVSSIRDLATWTHALYAGDVLSPESLALMLATHPRHGYGLGVRRVALDGNLGYGHGGSLRGFVSGIYRLPAQDIEVVMVTNLGLVSSAGLLDGLTRIAVKAYAPEPTDLWATVEGWFAGEEYEAA
jgi:D-alanyl-D-alanine carboxypeptidase